ncbi:CRISPR-associated protein Cst2 [Spirosoma lacussanchae]|uniref:DevR family CRISPR-associated autoregulator n=1 Tax=Spirosoma lacussanchae TaxID=1884249 RepID=UPI0011084A42|nr:DevR family CRISPR-associated autoregulator [Spirosoma lacussanchae]
MATLNNITGALVIDGTAAFLNGAGLGAGEDRNKVVPKVFEEMVNGRREKVPYVSAQAWRRWLRNTSNEENNWTPSELQAIGVSKKGTTNKISTQLDPIAFPEDDLFGYMRSGGNDKSGAGDEEDEDEAPAKTKAESVQRTSPFKCSVLKGIRGKRTLNVDEGFVHLKENTPLPYSTQFYAAHLEGFFNLEYYRLGQFDNLGSKQELASETVKQYADQLTYKPLGAKGTFKRFTLQNAEHSRKERAAGLLRGLAFLRGGAKQAAFGADVSPKVLILAGLECANPVFNNLFEGSGEMPSLKINALKQIIDDYQNKLATPVYIGIREGYLQNEAEVKALSNNSTIVVGSPVSVAQDFIKAHLTTTSNE